MDARSARGYKVFGPHAGRESAPPSPTLRSYVIAGSMTQTVMSTYLLFQTINQVVLSAI